MTTEMIRKYGSYCEEYEKMSETLKLWSHHNRDVKFLLEFIRATRNGSWDCHRKWLNLMIPLFFAYHRQNYSRYMPAYLLEMEKLPETHPFASAHLQEGQFSTQRTCHPFSGTAHDQTIEQTINRDAKVAGGWRADRPDIESKRRESVGVFSSWARDDDPSM